MTKPEAQLAMKPNTLNTLPLDPHNWSAGLHEACRQLRQSWQTDWCGLPKVLQLCQQTLHLNTVQDPTVMALNQFAEQVAQAMENQALSATAHAEPAYHNRLHTADVMVAVTTLMRIQEAHQLAAPEQTWVAALLAAAVAHDYQHPGGVNHSALSIEKATWLSASSMATAVPAPWRGQLEQWILHTDPQTVADNHLQVAHQPFEWCAPWCQVLLNEADILLSSTAEFGPSLSTALADEWQKLDFAAHATVATPAGRAFFLRSVRFSSPAAQTLSMPQQVQEQLSSL